VKLRSAINKLIPKSEFSRHLSTLLSGTVIAQAIPILAMPLLSRLYRPDEFGILAVYMGIATLFSVIVTGRYELAILLPKKNEEALTLFWSVCLFALLGSFALFIFALFGAGDYLSRILSNHNLDSYFLFLPLSVFLIATYQIFLFWFNRQKQFFKMALAAIVLQASMASIRIFFGVSKQNDSINGLILGLICGQALALFIFAALAYKEGKIKFTGLSLFSVKEVISKFKKFPIFNVPYSVLVTFSRDSIIYVFTAFGLLGPAGLFSFARSIISVPITFLSSSLGQVYYQKASELFGKPELESITNNLMRKLSWGLLPAFIFCAFWSPTLFSILFGSEWREAGKYAAIYSPAAFLFLFTSWPERLFEISGKQNISLMVQILSDTLIVAVVWTALKMQLPYTVVVGCYTIACCGYHLFYLNMLFKVAGFSLKNIYLLLGRILISSLIITMPLITLDLVIDNLSISFVMGGIWILLCYYFSYFNRLAR